MPHRHRGRLFRKYFLLILALVCGALLTSGAIGLYFSYEENKAALASLQREKAVAAAARIEQFVRQIEQQLAFAALPQLGAEGIEQRRIEFLKLLRLVPAVTDIAQIDGRGREQLAVSRLAMDVAGGNRDRSQEPAFANAKSGQTWFGPVYFRKETEPYMSIAVRSGGASGPVTVAEVNLKFIWDVVTRIKIGEKGKAYVVDGTGHLVADPDIGLVLRKTNLAGLEQVRTALEPGADDNLAMLARDLSGGAVLTAYAPIDPLGWRVFVEQPVSEVYAALDATILRTVLLIVAGLAFSALAAAWLARSMARPIGVLQEGAARIGAGELGERIDIRTGDELEALAAQFNRMSEQLRESYAGLERKVEARTAELRQALEFQGATGEILSSISSSIADTQPVFDAIVTNLLRLFRTQFAVVQLLRDGRIHMAALASADPRFERIRDDYPRPLDESTASGRAMLRGEVLQIAALSRDASSPSLSREQAAKYGGYEALICAPMMREGKIIGAVVTARREPGVFDDKQVALIRAFADQAVIAIENARLFNETKESLEQQTAISEILRVISSSPSDVQPVLEAVCERAARICEAGVADIVLAEGATMSVAASIGGLGRPLEALPVDRTTVMGRSIVDQVAVHVPDLQNAPESEFPTGRALARKHGHRTILAVPLLRERRTLGTILLRRPEVRPFEEKHISLLKTFADQAAIAIENVRLFNETKEALEQQTATAEVLKTISRSTFDLEAVLRTLMVNATRMCNAVKGVMFLPDAEGRFVPAVVHGYEPDSPMLAELRARPIRPGRGSGSGRALLERRVIHIPDVLADPQYNRRELAQLGSLRTLLAVPMLLRGEPIGVISMSRGTEVEPFNDRQLELVTTFADQAVIAIENVRLFNETKEALEHQKASAEVLEVISSSVADTGPVFDKILRSCERLFQGHHLGITLVGDDELIRLAAYWGPGKEMFHEAFPHTFDSRSGTAIAISERRVAHYPDVENGADVPERVRTTGRLTNTKSMVLAPMLWEGRGIGAVFVGRPILRPFSAKEIALLRTFADQAVIAIQNARLFREIQEKSSQLEIANKHKSEFLANMSHELRTPLNAIIGFSEVLMERMFGEVNDKQADYLKDIHESGRHLLSLINDILDLSKIEAGRMELELSSFHLPTALSNAMTLVRERAQRHGIELGLEVDPRLGEFQGDERKVKQILLNLLSNAVKFTPDGGRVDVSAKQAKEKIQIAVRDTGIGIAPEEHAAVFEEFKQVGRDYTRKAEGTGLGLALTKRFVELHGGEIRLESAPGKGSTFTVTLPLRH